MPDNIMFDRVKNLAQIMRDRKAAGDKFALMLGAGASLSSGVKPTDQLMREIVEVYGRGIPGGSIEERFGELWRQSTSDDRKLFLKKYLDTKPSKGYGELAKIVKMGYFDIIVTFNFDVLLETALVVESLAPPKDFRSIVRGDTDINAFARLVKAEDPPVKIVKLHGSLYASDYFLFSEDEMANYPPEIASLLEEITRRDIIICGYAFRDLCVARSFSQSPDAGSIHYVNPAGASGQVRGILFGRKSKDKVISGNIGKFDDFFSSLYQELVGLREPIQLRPKGQNPFKFMDCYRETDKEWFFGREELTAKMRDKIEKQEGKVLCVLGAAKIGKTSFIRAGLIAQLDPRKYECIYLRCQSDIKDQLHRHLERQFSLSLQAADLDTTLSEVKTKTPKRILVFFDQFQRLIRGYSGADYENLVNFMTSLMKNSDSHFTPVFISLDEKKFYELLFERFKGTMEKWDFEKMSPLEGNTLRDVIQKLISKAGVELNAQTVERLCNRYAENPKFTLAHVQTLCYYHVNGFNQDFRDYDSLPTGLSAALDSVTDDSNLMDLIDELSPEERRLIRSVMKVICHPDATLPRVVEFVKRNFTNPNPIGKESFPEPVTFPWR